MSEILASMSKLVPLLILALVALTLLLHWRSRRRDRAVTIEEFSGAQEALGSVLFGFAAEKRIFDPHDLAFVLRQSRPEILRQFQQDRKALAVSWLCRTRKQVVHLMDLHLKLASYTYEPGPTLELRLTLDYLSFSVVCHLLLILFWLRGPFHTRKMVGYTMGAAERFCVAFAKRHESINPARLAPSPN